MARDDEGTIPIPENGQFVDGTWEVDCTSIDILRETYNDNQEDEVVETKKVIHAYWKPLKRYPDECTCSNCGELAIKLNTKFCPECGATMDAKPE